MPKGYTSQQKVADYLGISFSEAQNIHAIYLLDVVEDFIDARVAHPWLEGVVSNEEQASNGEYIQLRNRPVASIASVTARTELGGAYSALVVNIDWEVISLIEGLIRIPSWATYDRFRISYTPATAAGTVPRDLEFAATQLVARWLTPVLTVSGAGAVDPNVIKSYSVGGEFSITYKDSQTSGGSFAGSGSNAVGLSPEEIIEKYAAKLIFS